MFRPALAAVLLIATPAAAQQLTPVETARIDTLVVDALKSSGVPSASVAIVRDGKIVFAKAYGDQGSGMKATSAAAKYQIASISKQFTAAALLLTIGPGSPLLQVALPCFVMGIGFGLVASPSVVAAQAAVDWSNRAVATGSTMFARSIGSAVGVAVFGAIANGVVRDRLGHAAPDLEHLAPGTLHPAIHAVFVASAAVAVLLVAASALMTAPDRGDSPASPSLRGADRPGTMES